MLKEDIPLTELAKALRTQPIQPCAKRHYLILSINDENVSYREVRGAQRTWVRPSGDRLVEFIVVTCRLFKFEPYPIICQYKLFLTALHTVLVST